MTTMNVPAHPTEREAHTGGPKELTVKDLHPHPIAQMRQWLQEAIDANPIQPTAMVLATATTDGKPSARVVLLKSVDDDGLVFFTNYESRKARELEANPHAALLFYWDLLERQVRVEGTMAKVSEKESREYFKTRPYLSQLSAWASKQSQVIPDRNILESEVTRLQREYKEKELPLPPFWGGYRLHPSVFEFWQGRENRLHDRFRYSLSGDHWTIERLSP